MNDCRQRFKELPREMWIVNRDIEHLYVLTSRNDAPVEIFERIQELGTVLDTLMDEYEKCAPCYALEALVGVELHDLYKEAHAFNAASNVRLLKRGEVFHFGNEATSFTYHDVDYNRKTIWLEKWGTVNGTFAELAYEQESDTIYVYDVWKRHSF